MSKETAVGAPMEETPLAQAQREVETLREALASRTTIGQAIGILMNERTITAEAAFAHLVELSSHTNVKVRDIAADLVDEATRRATSSPVAAALDGLRV